MEFFKKYTLPLVVFLTGACVLIIEIVATRILSPYFGNTIFTISSIISVVLAALSLGYYFGGKLSDKYPKEEVFYSIILISGLSVAFLHLLNLFLLPVIGYKLSVIRGPIITSIILFFIPSLLLGTLSPFAIKLQSKRFSKKGIGSIAGEIFFYSTMGSIFGSLTAGFVLIPKIGINQIILSIAIVLSLLGLIPLLRLKIKKSLFFIAFFLIFLIIFLNKAANFTDENTVYSQDGVYEKIIIYDGVFKEQPTRFFLQDRSNSGAMFLNSDDLVYDYTKYYSLNEIFNPDIKNALVIGGGAYSVPKVLLKDFPSATIDVAEIEPSLFDLSQKYFNIKEPERLNNYVEDGRRLLYDSEKKYDLIFSDVYYSLYSIPAHFTTIEFFNLAKEKLNREGIFIANLVGDLSRKENSLILSEIKTFKIAFPNSYFFATNSPGSSDPQNIIFVGYNSEKRIDLNGQKITNSKNPVIKSINEKNINLDRFELSLYKTITDNYSPVDYLTKNVLQKSFNKPNILDGKEMISIIDQQLRYGPRFLNSDGYIKVQKFLTEEMKTLSDEVKLQTWQHESSNGQKQQLTNIIASLSPEKKQRIILATHYDSKKFANKDENKKDQPVPGANDSASGVAIILELTRIIKHSPNKPNIGIDVIFFDGEEGEVDQKGNYGNWKPLGSSYFTEHLGEIYKEEKPASGIVLDMVCDKDLKISKEKSSVNYAPQQVEAFWSIAKDINDDVFQDSVLQEIRDDHTPLNNAGIPTFLLIDFDYPYFHTTEDTADKCSAKSLETVASAVLNYIYSIN